MSVSSRSLIQLMRCESARVSQSRFVFSATRQMQKIISSLSITGVVPVAEIESDSRVPRSASIGLRSATTRTFLAVRVPSMRVDAKTISWLSAYVFLLVLSRRARSGKNVSQCTMPVRA